jgi:hypothetical protein
MSTDNSWIIRVSYGEASSKTGIITETCFFMVYIGSGRELGFNMPRLFGGLGLLIGRLLRRPESFGMYILHRLYIWL